MAWVTAPVYTPGDAEADVAASVLGGGKTSRLYEALVHRTGSPRTSRPRSSRSATARCSRSRRPRSRGTAADELEAAIQRSSMRSSPTARRRRSWPRSRPRSRRRRSSAWSTRPGSRTGSTSTTTTSTIRATSTGTCSATPRSTRRTSGASPPTRCRATGGWSSTPNPARRCCPPTHRPRRWRTGTRRNGAVGGTVAQHRPRPRARGADGPARSPTFELDNGLPVYLVESHDLPITVASLVSRWGSAAEPAEQPGLAGFTADMLDEGTQTRDALGIAREIESLGASLSTGAGGDGSFVSVAALSPQMGQAMAVMSDIARAPAFPPAEIDRRAGRVARRAATAGRRPGRYRLHGGVARAVRSRPSERPHHRGGRRGIDRSHPGGTAALPPDGVHAPHVRVDPHGRPDRGSGSRAGHRALRQLDAQRDRPASPGPPSPHRSGCSSSTCPALPRPRWPSPSPGSA